MHAGVRQAGTGFAGRARARRGAAGDEDLAGTDLSVRLPIVAASAADATIPMLATRGRASFLGERSIGHMDPGARSSALIVASLCLALEG